jgi:hypothetical protein
MFSRNKRETNEVIDLREPAPEPKWGSPVPCPSCSGRGYLDHIDPYREVMFLHCIECFNKYEMSRSEFPADSNADAFTI